VPFNRDLERILPTLAALVNTGPEVSGVETLGDLDEIRDFVATYIITEVEPPNAAEIPKLHRLRRQLRAVFAAPDEAQIIEQVNALLSAAPIQPRLTDHDDLGLHIHYFPPYASLTDHLAADCAMALAELLETGEASRLRICAAPDCIRAFIDFSRNRSRLYCDSQTCGNRLHAAAYRARQRA
jgi:predicted RNA-binding Zn ribbon-like protein